MALPPDDPTRPMRPADSVPPPAVAGDDVVWREEVLGRLDGLRNGLLVVGVIAVLALALAAWTFLRESDDRDGSRRGGVSNAELETVRDELEDLESRLENRATKSDVAAIQKTEEDLAQQVEDLAGEATDEPATTTDTEARESLEQLKQSVTALDQSIADLDGRVQALEDQAQQP